MSIAMAIIAGGQGTRIRSVAADIPKCLIPVAGKTILEHQINLAIRYKLKSVLIQTGHLGEQVKDFIDSKDWPIEIKCIQEAEAQGTAGAFPMLNEEYADNIVVLYGDIILDINLQRMIDFHLQKDALATLFVHPNNHPHDSDLVEIDGQYKITALHRKPHKNDRYYANLVNAGAYVLNKSIQTYIHANKCDWVHDVFYKALKAEETIIAYKSSEYIKDMGTPDRLIQVENDISNGKVNARSFSNKQRCIFLDRDGTINVEVDCCHRHQDFALLENSIEAVKKINASIFLAIVVTNQPVIAKGLCDQKELKKIHNKMETELGHAGAYLDDIFYCPHHPEKGHPGEVLEYKIDCECRKPKSGLLKQAAEIYNIDLANSYIIGDTRKDIEAGANVATKTIAVKSGHPFSSDIGADYICEDILEAVNYILGKKD